MSDAKLCQLCLSYLAILQDPVVGAYQRRESYWTWIESHYNKHRPATSPVRSLKFLQDKFRKIKRDVTKFVAVHKQAKEQNPSRTSEDDIFEKAKELFYMKLSKDFTYKTCWRTLR
jgi:hypothetical protein